MVLKKNVVCKYGKDTWILGPSWVLIRIAPSINTNSVHQVCAAKRLNFSYRPGLKPGTLYLVPCMHES